MDEAKNTYFVEEVSNKQKLKYFLSTLFVLLLIVSAALLFSTIWYSNINELSWVKFITALVRDNILNLNLIGLFIANLVGGLFFVPSPDEVIFYYGLVKGNLPILVLIVSVLGYMIAQLINYFMGLKLSGPIMHIISKRKLYQVRRFTNKYGSFGIFVFNVLPSPAPLLTFGLALTRYNFKRLFFWTFLGKIIKYGTIVLVYFLL